MGNVGTSKIDRTKDAIKANSKINTDKKIKIAKAEDEKKEFYCSCCGKKYDKQQGNFMKSNFIIFSGNDKYVTTCKKCIDQLFNELTEFYTGNEEKAIEHICMMYGIYFNESPLSASKKISENRSRISTYSSKVQINPWIGLTWLDTLKERALDANNEDINAVDKNENIVISSNGLSTSEEVQKFFGKGYSDSDYEFLQEEYNDWTKRCECDGKSQELIFKEICFKELEIHKARLNKESTKDLDNSLQNYLDSGNLKPKQNTKATLSDSQSFGQLIKKWEDEKPIPEPTEEFKDVDGIGRYIDVFFKGHLAKSVGIANGLSNLYTRFMKKYTAKKPEYEGEEDNDALFDAIFGDESKDKTEW